MIFLFAMMIAWLVAAAYGQTVICRVILAVTPVGWLLGGAWIAAHGQALSGGNCTRCMEAGRWFCLHR